MQTQIGPVTVLVQPVKSAFSTSTFKVSTLAAILTPLIPILYKIAEEWIGTLPPGSWMAMAMPGVLAAVYGVLRYLTTNGARQATAQVAHAQALAAQPKVPENINADGDVNVGSTPEPSPDTPSVVAAQSPPITTTDSEPSPDFPTSIAKLLPEKDAPEIVVTPLDPPEDLPTAAVDLGADTSAELSEVAG